MKIQKLVTLEDDGETCEFAQFETPLDKNGRKIAADDTTTETVQPYFSTVAEYKAYQENGGLKLTKKASSESESQEEETQSSSANHAESEKGDQSPLKEIEVDGLMEQEIKI